MGKSVNGGLKVSGLEFGYTKTRVLSGIHMEAGRGTVTGLAGANGAGKSTLIQCIAGILSPDAGEITYEGRRIRDMGRKERARLLAYVPQSAKLSFPMSVEEFVTLGRRPYVEWNLTERDRKIVRENLHYLKIDGLKDKLMDEISGGEYQKAMLARALAQEPEILLLDEPTSALDIRYQMEAMQLLRKVARERNCVVLTIMHDLNLIARFAQEAVFMKRGKIVAAGLVESVLTRSVLEEVFETEVRLVPTEYGKLVIPMEGNECTTE
jgi:iron complex transport system ATP-binding protein